MYAVFVVSEIDPSRRTEAETMLKTRIAPQIKQAPGFVSGTWARSADGKEGRSIIVFESEEAARATLASVDRGNSFRWSRKAPHDERARSHSPSVTLGSGL